MSAAVTTVTVSREAIGAADAEVIVAAWLYPSGARVASGTVIAELMVEKASFELLAPASGTLRILVAPEVPFKADSAIAEIID